MIVDRGSFADMTGQGGSRVEKEVLV